jgi:hypothetical protein
VEVDGTGCGREGDFAVFPLASHKEPVGNPISLSQARYQHFLRGLATKPTWAASFSALSEAVPQL